MSTVINTNMSAIRTQNVYNRNNAQMNDALTKVATGMKINSAKDGAANWSISERMRERINSLNQANQNVQNDNAMMKTAEEGINNNIEILKTLKERALNAANASTSNDDRKVLQEEIKQLVAQIDTNASNVKFNGIKLLTGDVGNSSSTPATPTATNLLAFTGDSATDSLTDQSTLAAASILSSGTGKAVSLSWIDADSTAHTDVNTDTTVGNSSKIADLIDALNAKTSDSGLTFAFVAKGDVVGQDADGKNLTAKANGIKVTGAEGITGISFKIDSVSSAFSMSALGTSNTETAAAATQADPSATAQDGDSGDRWFQVGAESGLRITFNINKMLSTDFGEDGVDLSKINVTTTDAAAESIDLIDSALTTALAEATKIGALEQRLGYTADNITTQVENMEASDSAIRDADMAKEMTSYMKYMVLSQASQYMLAQSNQNAFSILNLLQA